MSTRSFPSFFLVLALAATNLLANGTPQPEPRKLGAEVSTHESPCPPCIKGPEYRYGKKTAPIQIILYSSLTCGHCANFHLNTLPQIKEKYIKPGKISIVLRFYPMDSPSLKATLYVRSLLDKSERRQAIDALYRNQEDWVFSKPEELALNIAAATRGNIIQVREALGNQDQELKVLKRIQRLDKRGIDATPTFTIGAKVYDWELSLEEFEEKVAPLLIQAEKDAAKQAAKEGE